jgi:hypothetical protein
MNFTITRKIGEHLPEHLHEQRQCLVPAPVGRSDTDAAP